MENEMFESMKMVSRPSRSGCFSEKTSLRAFSLIEALVICAIIGALALAGATTWVNRQKRNEGQECYYNLIRIEESFGKFRLSPDHRTTDPSTVTLNDLKPFLPDQVVPVCPSGGTYSLSADGRCACSLKSGVAQKNHDDGR